MGHNGAGKSTLLRMIFGELEQMQGEVRFCGEVLRGGSAERVRRGISYTAGGPAVFAGLTVEENLTIAASIVETDEKTVAERRTLVLDVFPQLGERLGAIAGSLSGGQQRMVAVSMAVIQGPRLLLLDEPSLGLAPQLVERLYQSIGEIRSRLGLAVLVVEQTINPAMLAADHVYVLRMGEVVFRGGEEALHDTAPLGML